MNNSTSKFHTCLLTAETDIRGILYPSGHKRHPEFVKLHNAIRIINVSQLVILAPDKPFL